MSLELPTPYVTLADADTYLAAREPWASSSDDNKNDALSQARIYIDSNYTCPNVDFDDTIPDEIQVSNCELANIYLTDSTTLYPDQTQRQVKKEMVIAGEVTTSKEYFSGKTSNVDPAQAVTAMLNGVCYFSGPQGQSSTSWLIRA